MTARQWERLRERLPVYARQYRGAFGGTSRTLEALMMCKPLSGWKEGPVFVTEGGDCFVEVTQNLANGIYYIDVHQPWLTPEGSLPP
jgi:hypothetical protein